MLIWALAKKDLRLLARDTRALVLLLAMPFVFIMVLGLSLGEGFGHKPDDRMRVSLVILDEAHVPGALLPNQRRLCDGLAALTATPAPDAFPAPALGALALADANRRVPLSWSQVILHDLETTEGIRIERIATEEEARQLVENRERPAVLVFGPHFSERVEHCSFLADKNAINPFFRDGVNLDELDVRFLHRPPKSAAAGVIEQVAQGSLMRVLLPWMIGKAFRRLSEKEFIDRLGNEVRLPVPKGAEFLFRLKSVPLSEGKASLNDALRVAASNPREMEDFQSKVGLGVQAALARQFEKYDLTAQDWAALTRQDPKLGGAGSALYQQDGSGLLRRGAYRYQILVPSYTVMFAFFLVLTVGWLFVGERRQGTLRRLQAAPLSRYQILLGKLLPCYGLSVLQALILLGAGKLVFDMRWGEQPLWLLPVVLATSLAAMGLALLVASLARTETQVALYGTLLVLVLAGVSGCLMPREMMPEEMVQLSHVTPHAWALDAYSELLVSKMPNYLDVAKSCGVLTAFGAGFLGLAWATLRLE
jgi:ABC-type transport system involved in cytochrome c biogenesis permease component